MHENCSEFHAFPAIYTRFIALGKATFRHYFQSKRHPSFEEFNPMNKLTKETSPDITPLQELDQRSREVFRYIVDSYLETGDPLGSRSISKQLPFSLSACQLRSLSVLLPFSFLSMIDEGC